MPKFKIRIVGALLLTFLSGNAAFSLVENPPSESKASTDSKDSTNSAIPNDSKSDNLLKLNIRLRELYADGRSQALEASYPVIICFGGSIALFDENGKKVEEVSNITDQYTTEKSVGHITLGLYSLLARASGTGKLDQKTIATLRELKPMIEAASSQLKEHGLSEKILKRQYKIIDSSLAYIDSVLAKGTVQKSELTKFTSSLGADLLANAYEAVSTQLAIIDHKVAEWKEKLGAEKFNKVKVVIAGGHMPRQKNSNFQYFARLFNVKEEGERIIYAENVQEADEALKLLGTHVLDEGVAVSFFHDKWRMHRDLLSDGAKQYLREHPPLSGK